MHVLKCKELCGREKCGISFQFYISLHFPSSATAFYIFPNLQTATKYQVAIQLVTILLIELFRVPISSRYTLTLYHQASSKRPRTQIMHVMLINEVQSLSVTTLQYLYFKTLSSLYLWYWQTFYFSFLLNV